MLIHVSKPDAYILDDYRAAMRLVTMEADVAVDFDGTRVVVTFTTSYPEFVAAFEAACGD